VTDRHSTVLLVVDVQETFAPPASLVACLTGLARRYPSVATLELHDEDKVPFAAQIGWTPRRADRCLVPVNQVFVKHGYLPPEALISHLQALAPARVLVGGIQADTCVMAAGFRLFDAGLHPTLLGFAIQGSSVDRDAAIARRLWAHHFHAVIDDPADLP
jgi:nicotinamidase-related amidase